MSWKRDSRLFDAIQDLTRTCECGHRIRLTIQYKRAICQFCGKMVYLNEEDKKREKFKEEMRRMIKNG